MTPRRRRRPDLLAISLILPLACAPSQGLGEACRIVQPPTALPAGLEESSGVAASRDHPGILWTHNDSGGDPEVAAVRVNGGRVGRVAVRGARVRDWEDLSLGPCPAGTCLYIGDIGDGDSRRAGIGIYRIAEPDPAAATTAEAEYYPARYPDGARDAEALFVLPDGGVYIVTKGRAEDVEIYRYPHPLVAGETVTLEPVRLLAAGPQSLEEQVTGASASPSGEWVAIRSYKRLRLWRTAELLAGAATPARTVDLMPLGEVQGEAVALLDNGGVVLTSEGGFPGATGSVAMAQCGLE